MKMTPWPPPKCVSVTMTGSPPWSRTSSAPTRWCCSLTLTDFTTATPQTPARASSPKSATTTTSTALLQVTAVSWGPAAWPLKSPPLASPPAGECPSCSPPPPTFPARCPTPTWVPRSTRPTADASPLGNSGRFTPPKSQVRCVSTPGPSPPSPPVAGRCFP